MIASSPATAASTGTAKFPRSGTGRLICSWSRDTDASKAFDASAGVREPLATRALVIANGHVPQGRAPGNAGPSSLRLRQASSARVWWQAKQSCSANSGQGADGDPARPLDKLRAAFVETNWPMAQ